MYFGTLARASRDVSISSLLLARYLDTLKPWSQQQFIMKPPCLQQAQPWRTAGVGVMNNGTPLPPTEKAVGHTFAMSSDLYYLDWRFQCLLRLYGKFQCLSACDGCATSRFTVSVVLINPRDKHLIVAV